MSNQLAIRAITGRDKARVLEICSTIWEGEDYLPEVYDSWVNDSGGEFAAAVDDRDRIIGFAKLTMFSVADAWIEGLRKDPKSQIRGVGRLLADHFLHRLAAVSQIKTIRFCTYIDNKESIGLFSKAGFNILEKRHHKFLDLPKLKFIPEYKANRAVELQDCAAVYNFINKLPGVKYLENGICLGWVVKPFNADLLRDEFIRRGQALGLSDRNGKLSALCLYTLKEGIYISFFYAPDAQSARQLLQKLKQIAYLSKQEYIGIMLHKNDADNNRFFKSFHFKSWEVEEDFLIFDFPPSKLQIYR